MPIYEEKPKRDQQPAGPIVAVDPKLSRALDFDGHDLFCNQEGYLSKEQKERLRNSQWFAQMDWPVVAVMGGIALLLAGGCVVGMLLLSGG